MAKSKCITPGYCFRDMLNTHREFGDKHGMDGKWEAIEWLAYHVGEISHRLGELEIRVEKMEKKK